MKISVHNVLLNLLDDKTYTVVLTITDNEGITHLFSMKPWETEIYIDKKFKLKQRKVK